MKVRNSKGELKEIVIKANDSIPANGIIDFDGDVVPEGYEKVEDKGEIYSTEEQRIGTWIDGKPLYRKAFDIKTISASNTDLVNVSNLNIETLIKLNGVIITDGGGKFPVPLYDSSSNYSVLFINEYNYIRGRAMVGNGTFSKLIVTVEYTKTTD